MELTRGLRAELLRGLRAELLKSYGKQIRSLEFFKWLSSSVMLLTYLSSSLLRRVLVIYDRSLHWSWFQASMATWLPYHPKTQSLLGLKHCLMHSFAPKFHIWRFPTVLQHPQGCCNTLSQFENVTKCSWPNTVFLSLEMKMWLPLTFCFGMVCNKPMISCKGPKTLESLGVMEYSPSSYWMRSFSS